MKLLEIDGKPIVDAKKPAMLHITPVDVQKGRKKAPDCCAAAQACMRQMHVPRAIVHLSRLYVEKPRHWIRYVTPSALRTEIISFDRGHRFEAGDYKLTPLQPTQRLGKRHTPRYKENRGTGKKQGERRKYAPVKGVRFSANPSIYAA